MNIERKICSSCNVSKETKFFNKNRCRNDNTQTYCKVCESKRSKYDRENRPRRRQLEKIASKKWIKRNYEKMKVYRREQSAKFYKEHPDKFFLYYIYSQYGIPAKEYLLLLKKNRYRCSICGIHQEKLKKRLVLDHDHKHCSGSKPCRKCIRGIICDKCNRGLGCFSDNIQSLLSAIKYIKNFKLGAFLQ